MDRIRLGYRFGDVTVDPHAHRVMRAGQPVLLEPKAFALLQVLLDHPGELLSRDELLDSVWKHRHVAPATLNRIVALLRRALGDDADTPHFIETVHGLGYRFVGALQLEGRDAPLDPEPGEAPSPRAMVAPEASVRQSQRVPFLLVMALLAVAAVAALSGQRPTPRVTEKSIAVLPFQNLAADKDNAYLVDGLRDEILTRLAGIRDIKVISRSSADQYPSRPPNLRNVAAQLGVATLLEGSVQKNAGSVHINLQLIDAASDSHLWAESYDRRLDDIFAVEREIAEQVAAALQARLLPDDSARVAREPTKSPEAYDYYLRSLSHFNTDAPLKKVFLPMEEGRKEVQAAIADLEKALAHDPDFALARALIAQTRMVLYWNFEQRSEELLAAAKNSAEEALAQQPGLGEAHLALALYHFYGYHNYTLALKEVELARPTMPNSAKVENYSGLILRRQGQWDRAIASYARFVALNPRQAEPHGQLMLMYWWAKRYAEAERELDTASELSGEPAEPSLMRAVFRMDLAGDMSLWPPALAGIKPGTDAWREEQQSFYAYAWFTRDFAGAQRIAETPGDPIWVFGNDAHVPREIWLAWVYTQLRDDAKARPLYEKARRDALAALEHSPQSADAHLVLGFAAAGLGLKDEAVREGIESTELTPVGRDAIDGPDYVGGLSLIYLYVHEYDKALDLLQKMVVMPALHMASPGFLALNPQWDPVRDDPRFARALAAGAAAIKSHPPGY